MLLLEDEYLYVMMAAAVAVGTLGSRLLRRTGASTLLPHERVSWTNPNVASHHVVGAAVVGLGWAIADSCPAPFAGQLAQGVGWSLFTIAGVLLGVWLYLRRQDRSAVTTSG